MSVLSTTDARRLDQRITIQQKSQSQTSTGAITFTWTNFATIWACVDALKANERFIAEQELPEGQYTFWIRWRGDLNTNMRINWKGRLFDIKGIPDQQKRGRFLAIFAETGVNVG